MTTVFQKYGLGVVAENKPRGDNRVNVTPHEKMPGFDGELTFNPQAETHEGTDSFGNAYSVKSTSDTTLSCDWLPMGANRVSAPDVRRGMQVEIFRQGDSDQFYWRYLGLDDHLMTLETAIYAWGANASAGGSAVDVSNCYYFEISTHESRVTFGTSTANGEPFKYTFQLNSADGEFVFTDDIGTLIEMASREGHIKMANADGTSFQIERGKVDVIANEAFNVTVGGTTWSMTPSGISAKAAIYDLQ